MRFVPLVLIVALTACKDSPAPPPKDPACPTSNCATDFAHSIDKTAQCLDWGSTGSGGASTAWCKISSVWNYCIAGPVQWEKNAEGKFWNKNAPGCDPMIDTRPKPAAAPQANNQTPPQQQPPAQPPTSSPPATPPAPVPPPVVPPTPPAAPPAAPAVDAGT